MQDEIRSRVFPNQIELTETEYQEYLKNMQYMAVVADQATKGNWLECIGRVKMASNCGICGATFTSKKARRAHMASKHGVQPHGAK